MKPEERVAVGRVILKRRKGLGLTQEHLAGESGVNRRTLQRAEKGQGIGQENLAALAVCFGVSVKELMDEAVKKGGPSPEMRVALKRIHEGAELVRLLGESVRHGWTLESGPADEHRYNEMVGEDVMVLADALGTKAKTEEERLGRVEQAQGIVRFVRKMGFWLFLGSYTEQFTARRRRQRRKATVVIAAPKRDPRIMWTGKGPVLDLVRDSRRLPLAAALAGHGTMYDWMENQLIAKSDGEFRVKDELRRIVREVLVEIREAEQQARKGKQ
jgi:transcriptional regulator with XRE-family HTH domain